MIPLCGLNHHKNTSGMSQDHMSVELRQQGQYLLHCATSPIARRFKWNKPLVVSPMVPSLQGRTPLYFPSEFLLQMAGHRAPNHPASNSELGHFSILLTSNRFKICKYNTDITQSGVGPWYKSGFGNILELFCRPPRLLSPRRFEQEGSQNLRPRALPPANTLRELFC